MLIMGHFTWLLLSHTAKHTPSSRPHCQATTRTHIPILQTDVQVWVSAAFPGDAHDALHLLENAVRSASRSSITLCPRPGLALGSGGATTTRTVEANDRDIHSNDMIMWPVTSLQSTHGSVWRHPFTLFQLSNQRRVKPSSAQGLRSLFFTFTRENVFRNQNEWSSLKNRVASWRFHQMIKWYCSSLTHWINLMSSLVAIVPRLAINTFLEFPRGSIKYLSIYLDINLHS